MRTSNLLTRTIILFRDALAFNLLKTFIRVKSPGVQRLTTTEFAQELTDPMQSQRLVLDARTEAEFDVSHLANARQLDSTSDLASVEALKEVTKATPIVVYCSVGYRSAVLSQRLKEAGFQNVSNLEGGLFQWANEDREIVRAGQPTQLVHPYNAVWGALLKRQKRFQK